MGSQARQSSSLQRKDLAWKIKEVTDQRHSLSFLHHPFRAICDIHAFRRTHEIILHSHLKAKNHILLGIFAERVLTLHFQRIKLLKFVKSKVINLCKDLKRHRQQKDTMAVGEALKSYVKCKIHLANKEKKKFGNLTSELLKDLGEHGDGYVEAKRYFSFLEMEHDVAIDGIIDREEVNLDGDDKKEIYRIQKQLESEKTSAGTVSEELENATWSEELENAIGSEELHSEGLEVEMELDSQSSEIDGIINGEEVNLEGDDKKEIYRIQKQLESEKTSAGTGSEELENATGSEELENATGSEKLEDATGSEKLHFEGEEVEMELDSQSSETKRNEIGAEKLVRDKAIKCRRPESTIM